MNQEDRKANDVDSTRDLKLANPKELTSPGIRVRVICLQGTGGYFILEVPLLATTKVGRAMKRRWSK